MTGHADRRRIIHALAVGTTVLAGLLAGGAGPAAAAGSSCPSTYSNEYTGTIASAHPRAYYRLGEQAAGGAIPSGTVARDEGGRTPGTYHGKVAGGAEGALQCDPSNFAVTFDGDGSAPGYVSVGTLGSVADFTIEGFSYSTEGQNGGPSNPNGNETLFGDYGSERLLIRPHSVYGDVFVGGVEYAVSVTTPSNTGVWVHWSFVRYLDTLTIYRNGVSVGAISGVPRANIPLRGDIGAQSSNHSYPFQGRLDEVDVRPTAISPIEAYADYGAATPTQASDSHCPVTFSNPYARTIGRAAPRNWYRLGDQRLGGAIPSGTVAHDEEGGSDGTYHGKVVGGAEGALQCDPNNFAVTFDGDGSAPGYVSLGTLGSVHDFTIEGLSFSTEGQNGGPPNPNGNETLFGDYGSERLLIRPRGVYGDVIIGGVKYAVQTNTPNNTGNWIHWAFVRSGSTLTIYRNGTRLGTTSGVPTSSIPLRGDIGAQSNRSYPFQGQLDEIALYGRALSAAEVKGHHSASFPAQAPPDQAG
jgi:hypothetical protein